MTWRCICCHMTSHMLHDITIAAMASPIFVRSVRYSSIWGKDNFRDVYKKSILKLSLPEQMAPGFVKFKMGAQTGVVFPTAFLANEDVVCFVDFHHLPYMASLTTRYCVCTTCKMTKPCEWTSLVFESDVISVVTDARFDVTDICLFKVPSMFHPQDNLITRFRVTWIVRGECNFSFRFRLFI